MLRGFCALLPRSCVCWSLQLWSFSSFAGTPSLCTNLFWTLRCCLEHLYPLLGHTLLLLSVLVQAVLSTFPAQRPVAAREYPHREALWSPVSRRLLARPSPALSQRGSDVFLTSPSLHRDFSRHSLLSRRPHRESVLRTSLFTAKVSCARRFTCLLRLTRAGTNFMSHSRCLACVAVTT